MRPKHGILKRKAVGLVIPSLLLFLCCSTLCAQQGVEGPVIDQETVRLLMKRIDHLEARVKELEAAKQQGDGGAHAAPVASANTPTAAETRSTSSPKLAAKEVSANSQTPASPSPTADSPDLHPSRDSEQAESENVTTERLDLSKTLLRIRGFGDVSLQGDTRKGDSTFFSLGQLDLFVTSEMSERFKFLADILFEGGPHYNFSLNSVPPTTLNVDLERYQLQYSLNDYLSLSAGRGHVAIGYYSTAYQHSTWLQTATGRPLLYEFEDSGGILPIHMIGVSASGMIPSGALGLHYVAEVGNGRAVRNPLEQEAIANPIDDENHIAYNFALFGRPDAIPGFQTGFSDYRDVLSPANAPKIAENIFAGHAILIRPKYEWLNEAVLDHQSLVGTSTVFNTPGFYSQVSRQYGSYRPYLRYQYLNVAKNEPVFPDAALRHGPSFGLRYDASESVALKFQYDYTFLRNQPGFHSLTTQVGFTF